ncbi:MAG: FKBP-type peptidyl-prolyl cis-trans isomerase [Balneola sp.]
MKKPLLLSAIIISSLVSCGKDCDFEPDLNVNQTQLAKDIEAIDAYLEGYQEENNVQVESHPSGIRYLIKREGSGNKPGNCSQVRVSYEGKLISTGFVFDDGTERIRVFDLRSLIPGWQIGIPLIKDAGRITLFIPSVYAYGADGRPDSGIPPNANLQFEIILYESF